MTYPARRDFKWNCVRSETAVLLRRRQSLCRAKGLYKSTIAKTIRSIALKPLSAVSNGIFK
jgi:hypothetical protein